MNLGLRFRQKITIKTNLIPGSITQAGPSIKKDWSSPAWEPAAPAWVHKKILDARTRPSGTVVRKSNNSGIFQGQTTCAQFLIFFQNMLELPALGPRSKMPLSQGYSDRKPSKSLKCFPWSLADGGTPVHARKLGSGGGDPLRNHRGAFPDW